MKKYGYKSGFQIHCTQFTLFLGNFGQTLLVYTTLAILTINFDTWLESYESNSFRPNKGGYIMSIMYNVTEIILWLVYKEDIKPLHNNLLYIEEKSLKNANFVFCLRKMSLTFVPQRHTLKDREYFHNNSGFHNLLLKERKQIPSKFLPNTQKRIENSIFRGKYFYKPRVLTNKLIAKYKSKL